MILYQIIHGGTWAWALAHRFTAMRDKEAILVVDDSTDLGFWGFGAGKNFDGYIQAGIFSQVIHFNGTVGDRLKTEQEIEKAILETYDDLFRKNGIDFSALEAVYTSADFHHSFGVYLTLKGIHYYFYETVPNLIKSRYPRGHNGTTWVYGELECKYGAYNANNPLITPIFLPQSQNPFPPDKKVEYFDPDISKIAAEDIEKLRLLWGFDPSAIPRENTCLVACINSWAIRGIALIERSDAMMKKYGRNTEALYCLMVQLSLDYFLRDGFTPVVKWHPSVEIPNAAVNLPGAVVIDRIIDMAFFNYFLKQNGISFEQFISYGSTSVSKAADISDKTHLNLRAFVFSFHLANRIFVILKMIEKLSVSSIKAAFIDPKWRPYADAVRIFAEVLFGIKTDIIPADKLSAEDAAVVVVDPISKITSGFYAKIAQWTDITVFFPAADTSTTPDGILQHGLVRAYMQRYVAKKPLEHSTLSADDEAFNIICLKQEAYAVLKDFQFSRALKYAQAEVNLKPMVLVLGQTESISQLKQKSAVANMRISRVLVTGGGSGIGLAVAKRLLDAGCYVCIAGRNVEKLRKAQAEIGSDKLSVLQWDVKDIAVLSDKLQEAASLLGGYFDGVVQSAGVYRHVFIKDTNEAAWDAVMDTNAKAPFFIMQKACQYFQQNHIQGNICNISSCLGDSDRNIPGPYAASKLLCTRFTRSFGRAYAPQGIVINGVAPGDVTTAMCPQGGAKNLLKRASTTGEVAEAVALLLSNTGGGGYSIVAETILVNYLEEL
jgi:NAD(P)-dependent dehydrogenase (short-subunit alcohol dehydrogenase family)